METGSVSKTCLSNELASLQANPSPPSLKPVRYYHQNKGHNPSDRASIPSRAAQSVLLAQATSERFQPQTLRTLRLCNKLTLRLKSQPMQQIHPNHPKKSKQKWSNAACFGEQILPSLLESSWSPKRQQVGKERCTESLRPDCSTAAGLSVPSASANRGTSLKKINESICPHSYRSRQDWQQ